MDEFDVKRIALEAAASLRPVNTEALISAAKEIEKFLRGENGMRATTRVQQVADLVAAGFTRKAIAEKLGVAPQTVTVYRQRAGAMPARKSSPELTMKRRATLAKARFAHAQKLASRPADASAQ